MAVNYKKVTTIIHAEMSFLCTLFVCFVLYLLCMFLFENQWPSVFTLHITLHVTYITY